MKRKRSMLLSLLAGTLAIITIPTLISSLFFLHIVPQRMEQQTEANASFYIEQAVDSIESAIGISREITFNCMADSVLRSTMHIGNASLPSQGRDRLDRIVGSTTNFWLDRNRRAMNSIYIFRNDGAFISYSNAGAYAERNRRMQQIYFEAFGHASARTLYQFASDPNHLYFLLDYTNIDTLSVLGKMIVELDPSPIVSASGLTELYPGTCLRLLGGDDLTCVYQVGETPDQIDNTSIGTPDSSRTEDRQFYHIRSRIGTYDLWMDVYIPATAMYQDIWTTSQLFLSLTLLAVVLMLLLVWILFQTMRRPLERMEHILQQMPASDYSLRLPDSGFRELEKLETSFNWMADSLDAAFEDAYQKGVRLQESESRLLASQIDPHFIFNVLETINMHCIDAGQKDISRIVTDLAQFLRGNIGARSDRQKITFAEELDYVRYYIDLQQSRFGEQLTFSIDYEDEEILNYHLPRLSIQPLVENAVVHGLEPRRGMGHISIQLWEEENCVAVRVTDNGIGFDAGQLNLDPAQEVRHNHIAIPNILRRLNLLYGSQASFQLNSRPGEGTEVLMTIPFD